MRLVTLHCSCQSHVFSLGSGDLNNSLSQKSEDEESNRAKKPITSIEWNPNRSHHCIIVGVGKCAVIIATGTGGIDDAEVTDALLSDALSVKGGGNIAPESRASKAVKWISLKKFNKQAGSSATPISAYGGLTGPLLSFKPIGM